MSEKTKKQSEGGGGQFLLDGMMSPSHKRVFSSSLPLVRSFVRSVRLAEYMFEND